MVKSQTATVVWTCSACLRAQARRRAFVARRTQQRAFSTTKAADEQNTDKQTGHVSSEGQEQGAMSRRLADMAEETMDTGSKADRKMLSDAGFSDELKKQLEERIARVAFQAENQQAIGIATMPSSAGKGTRDQAAAKPWDGKESLRDSALRMLDDSHKKLRTPSRKPTLSTGVSLKPKPKKRMSVADRLANARDKTSVYTLQQESMTDAEREKFKQELKDRFQPGARPMPTTLQGLTSLANERIEDAIARGQFRHIQRGKGVNIERDYTASSPFLDTTEYFMNKIIQKQEIVPPWIEKQQELVKLVNTFRQRLRNDWRRHAARTISSKGGSLEDKIRRAKAFALAEDKHNPRPLTRSESISSIDATGMLTTISIEQRIAAGVAIEPAEDPVEIKVTEVAPAQDAAGLPISGEGEKLSEESVIIVNASETQEQSALSEAPGDLVGMNPGQEPDAGIEPATSAPGSRVAERVLPMAYPFRDESWEQNEKSYHDLAIREINDLARSYNLMAPKIAQKPYYNLARELSRCYADVAPSLPDEILNRSKKGPVRIQVTMHKEGSIMDKFQGTGHVGAIRDEPEKRGYGFKEFWRDLFAKDEKPKRVT